MLDRIYIAVGFPEIGDPEVLYISTEEDAKNFADSGLARAAADDALKGKEFVRCEIFRNSSRRLRNTDNETARVGLQSRSDAIHAEAHRQLKEFVAQFKAEHKNAVPGVVLERQEMARIMAELEKSTPLPGQPRGQSVPPAAFLEQEEARRKEVLARGGSITSPAWLVEKIEKERAAKEAADAKTAEEKAAADYKIAAEKEAADKLASEKPKTGAAKVASESK